jgi:hypothetical protein
MKKSITLFSLFLLSATTLTAAEQQIPFNHQVYDLADDLMNA